MPKVKKEALEKDEFSHLKLQQLKLQSSISKSRRDKMDNYQWEINYGHVEQRDKLKKEEQKRLSPKKKKFDKLKLKSIDTSVSRRQTMYDSPEKSDEYQFGIADEGRKQVAKLVSSPALILRNEPHFERGHESTQNATQVGDFTQ